MQNENNNNQHWKVKLESIESLSAQTRMNKEVAWEKLHQKLQQKPQRKKMVLYWAAAACLLPLLFLFLLPHHQNTNLVVKNIIHSSTVTKPSVKRIEPTHKEVVITKATTSFINKRREAKNRITSDVSAEKNKGKIPDSNNDSIMKTKAVVTIIPNDSNVAKTTAIVEQKIKLKVVHINELNEPAEVTPMMAHNMNNRFFPLQIARGEAYGISPRRTFFDSSRLRIFRFN